MRWLALAMLLTGCEAADPAAPGAETPLLRPEGITPARAQPTERLAYGPSRSQFVEFWAPPAGTTRPPVVVLIHGGCWQAQYGLDLMRPMAEALARDGYAVWNIEYRRLGEPSGGWPATFDDVRGAVGFVQTLGAGRGHDVGRTVLVGHSAGGHLALWAAGWPHRLPADAIDPPPRPVLSLGGVGDLEGAARDPTFSGACGADTIARLVDGAGRNGDPYALTSPSRFPPPASRQIMLHGAREQITPAALGEAYARGRPNVSVTVVPGAGHFEVIAPQSPAWPAVLSAIAELSK